MKNIPDGLKLIFVYGTLKEHDCRSHLLNDSLFINKASTLASYRLYHLGSYPGLIGPLEISGNSIEGELYAVADRCLVRLDEEEGVHEGLYERRPIQLQAPYDTMPVEAYFYLGEVSQFQDIGRCWEVPGSHQ